MLERENNRGPIVIVGAGVAGLTLGYLLSHAGKSVVLVEKEDRVGGLARSYRYGDFTFDIGPHRFHTDDQEVLRFIKEVFEKDHTVIRRRSGVYMFGKYFDWPLGSSSLFKLPPIIMVKAFVDLLSKYKVTDPDSFTEYTISRYGKTLYKAFFEFYTEKFIHIPCTDVHVDWATAGINRAVIDKRVKSNNLFDLVKGVLLPQKVDTDFLYPSEPGVDHFCEKLAAGIIERDGKIYKDTEVSQISTADGIITEVALTNEEKIPVETLVWSGEIHSVARMLGLGPYPLRYLSMVCYNVAVKGEVNQTYQWIYYGDKRTTINRVTVPHLFNARNIPEGYSGINVEVTCFEGDQTWQHPEIHLPVVRKDIMGSKLISNGKSIEEIWMEKVRNTYPIYDLHYKKNLSVAMNDLEGIKNLLMLGRCGTFWYNNMDHSMKMAMDYADHLITGKEIAGKEVYFAI